MHILPYKRVHAHTHKHTHTRTDNKIEGTEPEEQRMRPATWGEWEGRPMPFPRPSWGDRRAQGTERRRQGERESGDAPQ